MKKTNMKKRRAKSNLSQLVKSAHEAGVKVDVSLEPKTKSYWHVSYICSTGRLVNFDVTTGLGAVEVVARMINLDASSICIQRGQLTSP